MVLKILPFAYVLVFSFSLQAQQAALSGVVGNDEAVIAGATITFGNQSVVSDSTGRFAFEVSAGRYLIQVTAVGFAPYRQNILIKSGEAKQLRINLESEAATLNAVVVTGTMKPASRLQSPIAVEVYHPQFFKKNPAPSVFEAMQGINGVRPQINCSVCNTGDIHINGLEGPYTMVTIDGMPIVSALASVYGLFGIPTQLIERVEVVKGPASGLYGSEAVGGLINIITRAPEKAPKLSVQVISTSWLEHNADLGIKFKAGKHAALAGVHYYNYSNPIDKNGDNFTDVTLQHRASFFTKWSFARKSGFKSTIAARYFGENRWGGEMQWRRAFAGSDSMYAETIRTRRWELIGTYQLPITEKVFLSFSATGHRQRSFYGQTPYNGDQQIFFGQAAWDKDWNNNHSVLAGLAVRFNKYDDNTTATQDTLTRRSQPDRSLLPGVFIQDEWRFAPAHSLLAGLRYDYHAMHGSIFTPRLAWKWSLGEQSALRLNAGTGFRVVNLFTEDHAALTGARTVEIKETLRPEQSYNINVNYTVPISNLPHLVLLDLSVWYSYFHNQILPDYDTDPAKIMYSNLKGHAVSKGVSINAEINIFQRLKGAVGATLQDVGRYEGKAAHKIRPVLTERWSGTWNLTYTLPKAGVTFDYTGNTYGPMRLPLASVLDPRPEYAPVWSVQNIQITKWLSESWELFGGVKNMLNWTPARRLPFLIARAHDPFNKEVQYDTAGKALPTNGNPYALTFDPSYVYAPNQGRRIFLGARYQVK